MKLRWCLPTVLVLIGACVAWPQAKYPQPKYPQETTNAALRYWMAFADMQDSPADTATQDLLEKTVVGEAPWNEKILGPILDANGPAIRMMQRAAKLPNCDWGLEYDRGPRASIAYAPRARVLARLNTLEGMREMSSGNSQSALDSWIAGIRFSEHLAKGGTLIFALIAKSALLPNLRTLTSETKQGHLTEIQKNKVLVAVKELREDGFDWSAAWGVEGNVGIAIFAEVGTAANPKAEYEKLIGKGMPDGATVPSPEDAAKYREYMTAVQSALKLPPQQTKVRLTALESQRNSLPEVVNRIIPSTQKTNDARIEVFAAREELLQALTAK
jgi:hypothetical protein